MESEIGNKRRIMLNVSESTIERLVLHKVGKKDQEEDIQFSKRDLVLQNDLKELLVRYFLKPFKSEELYNFFHETDLNLNEVYNSIEKIFSNPTALYENSVKLAKHLYENSKHPNVPSGEFYVVYFKNCEYNYEVVDAIGLFKSETRDTFLKVYPKDDNFEIITEQGIDIKKLDKGCLILNLEKENGYIVSLVDNLSKNDDARYWIDDFLRIRQREDNFFHTGQVIKMYKEFVVNKLPEEYQISKADQASLINKSKQFFKENDNFALNEFSQKVFEQPEIIESFNKYKTNYELENEVQISTEFEISDSAVKKQSRVFKSVIKLDKNFHIYVHGNREFIVKGFDDKTGLQYYQVFFKNEM